MDLSVRIDPIPDFPSPMGTHELAWAHLLDAIFSDAFHAGLETLEVSLPTRELAEPARVRAEAGSRTLLEGGAGVALLGSFRPPIGPWKRVYTVEFGWLAPRRFRKHNGCVPRGAELQRELHVFGLRARLLGIPIRTAGILGIPSWQDRVMANMRASFATDRKGIAYYHLRVWGR